MRLISPVALGMTTAVAGAQPAGVDAADLVVRLTWSTDRASIGDIVTATVTASWVGPSTSYLSFVAIDLIASISGPITFEDSASVPVVSWNNPDLGSSGVGRVRGADIIGLNAVQIAGFGDVVTDNPILITTFDVTVTSEQPLFYTARGSVAGGSDLFALSDTSSGFELITFGPEVFLSETVFVPAPAGVLPLGVLGLLVGGRRRR